MISRSDCANALRILAMDAVEQAKSGHPGMPLGMADIAEVLWRDFLRHDPNHPEWLNRDRFVLSNGHGSMLQYALLHLTGYDLSLEDLKAFRQLHSKTPGHPEYQLTPGVETTTGPLGQGLANAVGMALAQKMLAAQFNRPEYDLFDYHVYAFAGDGCMMEGISHEACSLAGTWQLDKLIVFYDSNRISIDGQTDLWFSDNTAERFMAYGWQVLEVDGHNAKKIANVIVRAQKSQTAPTLIICHTEIACGVPDLAGTAQTHGAPLGANAITATRQALNWPESAHFVIPDTIRTAWDARAQGAERYTTWQLLWTRYQQAFPDLAQQLDRVLQHHWPKDLEAHWQALLQQAAQTSEALATRKSSWMVLNQIAPQLPELVGGSADLTESNLTAWKGMQTFSVAQPSGRYIHYGVREFAMTAIMNGLALSQLLIPFGGTFLVFSDYARNAIRLAALMQLRVIYVLTHDSIGLGEDGPTHQPIEHAAMLRLTPNLTVWRPADFLETVVAWQQALQNTRGPTALLLSRQVTPPLHLPTETELTARAAMIAKGAYVVWRNHESEAELILIATGTEVALAIQAATVLAARGVSLQVVSMPCTSVFDAQPKGYRESVLPSVCRRRIAIEAAAADYWYKYVGLDGKIMGISRFGESAPAAKVYAALGLTVDAVVEEALALF